MQELIIPKQQIGFNRTTLDSLLNNATYQIKERMITREGSNGKLLAGIYSALLTFFAEQKTIRDLLKERVKEKFAADFNLVYATYLAAERAADFVHEPEDLEGAASQDRFRGFFVDFSRDFPQPRNSMLEVYSKLLPQDKNSDLSELTNAYFEWLRNQSLAVADQSGWSKYNELIRQITIKFEGDTRVFRGFDESSYSPENNSALALSWDDLGGYEEAKSKLKDLVLIIKNIDHFREYMSIESLLPKGILLIGPPGTGKTFLANIMCAQAGIPFISFGAEDIGSKYQFETAIRLKKKFQEAAYHVLKGSYPASLLFIDEIEAITATRYDSNDNNDAAKVVNTFNTYMCGNKATPGVIVMGATNLPKVIDPAIMRPGRFSYKIYIGYPTESELEAIFRVNVNKYNRNPEQPLFGRIDYKDLSSFCSNRELIEQIKNDPDYSTNHGFTGAVVKDVFENALRDHVIVCFKEQRIVTPLSTENLLKYFAVYKEKTASNPS